VNQEKEQNGLWLIFSVSDTGRGIRKEDIDSLFFKYAKFDTRANHHIEGAGLGLPIAKNMAELMGGAITVESEYGKGSVFTVRIKQGLVDPAPMEAAARAGDIETIKTKNSGLVETVETLISGLNELAAKAEKNRGKKQRAAAPDPDLLGRLLEACKEYRPVLMEEAVRELEKYDYDSGGDLVAWLREQLDSLDYDVIQDRLENQNGLSKTVTMILQEENYGKR
jgi:hypothetical protein